MPCIIDPELCRLLASRSPRTGEGRSEPAETLDASILTASGLVCLAILIGGIAWT